MSFVDHICRYCQSPGEETVCESSKMGGRQRRPSNPSGGDPGSSLTELQAVVGALCACLRRSVEALGYRLFLHIDGPPAAPTIFKLDLPCRVSSIWVYASQ